MPDVENTEPTAVTPDRDHPSDERPISSSRRAAAVEAAYILEAVRK